MQHFDVIVVGAGISGLTAAKLLKQQAPTIRVAVLEASDRVGGRTLVDQDGTDLGGAYFGPTQDRIMKHIDDLGLKMQRVNTKGKTVQQLQGTIKHYEGVIPPISPLGLLDLNAVMVDMDQLVSKIDLVNPHLSPNAAELDSITAAELIRSRVWTDGAKRALRIGVQGVLCVNPEEVSALCFLWYIAQSGGVKRIFETENGAQDSNVIGGAGHIALGLCKEVKALGAEVILEAPVRTLEYTDPTNVVLHVMPPSKNNGTASLRMYSAPHVILAIPPVQQLRIHYDPPLSANRFQGLQRWPMGHIIKTFTFYAKPFWRDLGLNGMTISDEGVVSVSIESIKPDGSSPALMGFVLCDHAAVESCRTKDQRKMAITEHYRRVFQSDEALKPVAYKEKCWAEEPWVGGCYVGVLPPSVITKFKFEHRCPFAGDRVFIAGTEAAYAMVGYMDGAVEAGERAARNVLVKRGVLDAQHYEKVSLYPPSKQLPFVPMEISRAERMLPSVPQLMFVGATLLVVAAAWYVKRH